jgi:hypothetical protein
LKSFRIPEQIPEKLNRRSPRTQRGCLKDEGGKMKDESEHLLIPNRTWRGSLAFLCDLSDLLFN